MTYAPAELYEKFKNLPDDVQNSFLSIDTYNILHKIVERYHLHVDQSGLLSEEVGLVMLGATRPDDFLTSIQTKLGIPLETAGNIVKDINTEIFFPIRSSLEALNNGGISKYRESAPLVEHFSPAGEVSERNIPKPQTPLRNPDNNAIIINEEVKEKAPRSDRQIFDEKMSKLFRLPKEEVDLGNSDGKSSNQPNTSGSVDPYREIPK